MRENGDALRASSLNFNVFSDILGNDLFNFKDVCYGQLIQKAIDELKAEKLQFKAPYWTSLALRCCKIVERVKSSGHSYERSSIETWLDDDCCDPFTREEIKISQLVPNRNLKEAIEHYRRHLEFSVGSAN
ncbi:hypothetical protein C1646_763752 [Rhizophagus diaphanus]|nr:hypothetical protein C1646_763752 [Rhizophagus diaphanus] [Rhizophagus sp. MUCL 43196]